MIKVKLFYLANLSPSSEELERALNDFLQEREIAPEDVISFAHSQWVNDMTGEFCAYVYYRT